MSKTKYFYATRPSLAGQLMQSGCVGTKTQNVWKQSKYAWRFEVTPKVIEVVTSYYGDRGLPLPISAAKAFGEVGK